MQPIKLVTFTAPFPPLFWWWAALRADTVLVEGHEHFSKQSYRNRMVYRDQAGLQAFTLPVLKQSGQKQHINTIAIDYAQPWHAKLWHALQTAYGKSPYWHLIASDLEQLLYSKPTTLWAFNTASLTLCQQWLGIQLTTSQTADYQATYPDYCIDIRPYAEPKAAGLPAINPYAGPLGADFAPSLSILDSICCLGPETKTLLFA